LLASSCALVLLLALPALAEATLTYVKYGHYPLKPTVFAANDDGSGARPVGRGQVPLASPNGRLIAYRNEAVPGGWKRLKVVSASGGPSNQLIDASVISEVVWSPTSTTLAAVRGSGKGWDKLVLVELPTGGQTVVDVGYFSGVSFSPDGSELVYSRAPRHGSPLHSDIFRASVSGGRPSRITYDRRSQDPLWGPDDEIAFVRQEDGRRKGDLFLMNPQGGQVRRVTGSRHRRRYFPLDWSADGDRLLTSMHHGKRATTVLFDLHGDHKWKVRQRRMPGFVGSDLSADGERVLGANGKPDPLAKHLVGTVPAAGGGSMHVLGEFAYEPDWSQ
jgi:Tol biopolymer transport system component